MVAGKQGHHQEERSAKDFIRKIKTNKTLSYSPVKSACHLRSPGTGDASSSFSTHRTQTDHKQATVVTETGFCMLEVSKDPYRIAKPSTKSWPSE